MQSRTLSKHDITQWLTRLIATSQVVAPIALGNHTAFRTITSPDHIAWQGNTTVPPTEYLLPQAENLFSYQRRGSEVDLTYQIDDTLRIIFGIRPCDVHSLRMMDRVFLHGHTDPYYQARRTHTTLIAMTCTSPASSCFCSSFGTGPDLPDGAGADLALTDLGDTYYVQVFTERGQALVAAQADIFPLATSDDHALADATHQKAQASIKRTLNVDGLSQAIGTMFDSPYWETISRKCIACGACTYLCPVCYCFDIEETCARDTGTRSRCWDACTYRSFTQLAGGHNPRPTITEGYRQKMYHKFNYAVQRYDESLCVGCGRCMVSCPVNLDIVQILNEAHQVAKGDVC